MRFAGPVALLASLLAFGVPTSDACAGVALDTDLIQTSGDPAVASGKFYGYRLPDEGPGDQAFSNAFLKARSEHVPLVVIWSHESCHYCDAFIKSLNSSKSAVAKWLAENRAVFAFFKATGYWSDLTHSDETADAGPGITKPKACLDAWLFSQERGSEYPWPLISFYYEKADGSVVDFGYTTEADEGKDFKWLSSRFAKWSSDNHLGNYPGGSFAVSGTEFDRYEAEPSTHFVDVLLTRTADDAFFAATNALHAFAPRENGPFFSTNVAWEVGVTERRVRVALDLSPFPEAGEAIELRLADAYGNVTCTTPIACRTPKTDAANPLWIGERTEDTLAYGEWTMDLDLATNLVAKASAKGERAYTLVLMAGSLWCPDCYRADHNFLGLEDASGANRFSTWAVKNNVRLVMVDIPRMKKLASGELDMTPTLLSRQCGTGFGPGGTGSYPKSGVGYLARKMIDDEAASACAARNAFLAATNTDKGGFHRPEDTNALRTGVPIFVLLRPDGSVAARLTRMASVSPTEADQAHFEDYLRRFDEMLALADGAHADPSEIANNHLSTTPLVLSSDGGLASSELCHADIQDAFRLEGAGAGTYQYVQVRGESAAQVRIDFLRADADGGVETVASSTGLLSNAVELSHRFEEAGDYFVQVQGASVTATEFSVDNPSADNFHGYEISTAALLDPGEKASEAWAPADGDKVRMRVVGGTLYRVTGIVPDSGVADGFEPIGNPDEHLYLAAGTASDERIVTLTTTEVHGRVAFQIWRPGRIAFVNREERVIEYAGTGTVQVVRQDGGSSAASVWVRKVSADPGAEGRYAWTDQRIDWADGESGVREVGFGLLPNERFEDDASFTLQLFPDSGCAAVVPEDATNRIVICDTDAPCFEKMAYDVTVNRNFDSPASFKVINLLEGGAVSVALADGSSALPNGLRLAYDAASGEIVLSGLPTKAGDYTFSCLVSEDRQGGRSTGFETKFRVTVAEPSERNPKIALARPNQRLPLFEKVGGSDRLTGLLSLAVSSRGQVSARYSGAEARSVSFAGNWQSLGPDGTAVAALTSGDAQLDVRMDVNGRISAVLRLDGGLLAASADWPETGVYGAFRGYYTVTLPVAQPDDGERTAQPTGTAVLTLKMSDEASVAEGTVLYAGVLPDGTSVSGSTAFRDVQAEGERAFLPVFARTAESVFGVDLTVLGHGADNWCSDSVFAREIVWHRDGTVPYVRLRTATQAVETELAASGSYYLPGTSAGTFHRLFYAERYGTNTPYVLRFDLSHAAGSERYGGFSVTTGVARIQNDRLALDPNPGLSFDLSARTGVFTGTVRMAFEGGDEPLTVNGEFRGVVIPGWCLPCDCGYTAPERPFGSGQLVFRDFVDGRQVMRSLPVTLDILKQGTDVAQAASTTGHFPVVRSEEGTDGPAEPPSESEPPAPSAESGAEDMLYLDLAADMGGADLDGRVIVYPGDDYQVTLNVDSVSKPTVSVSGLPSGLKFDAKTMTIYGSPTKPGLSTVKVTAKNKGGFTYSQVVYFLTEGVSTERIDGCDFIALVGDEVDEGLASFFAIYADESEIKTVSLSGLPAGLAFRTTQTDDGVDRRIVGSPTKAGLSVVTCKVAFRDGTSESATAIFEVVEEPWQYDVDLDFFVLDGRTVGDRCVAEDGFVLGSYDSIAKVGIVSVSGLPTGLTAIKEDVGSGVFRYVLDGQFTKAGEFTASAKISYLDEASGNILTRTLSHRTVVAAAQDMQVSASVADPERAPGCKVTGSGVYSVCKAITLSATAARGYVFAGWTDDEGFPVSLDGLDYRTAKMKGTVDPDLPMVIWARFVPEAEDELDLSDLEGREIALDPGLSMSERFAVTSASLPKLTFKTLPTGVSCDLAPDGFSDFVLSYEPAAKKQPKPGKYRIVATAKNASRTSTAEFLITVSNLADADIRVADDYGTLTPSVAMTPISLSNAVDFARGDTLKVSGLPSGVSYDARGFPRMLSGTPTKPGEYTLEFSAKIVVSAVTNSIGRVTVQYRDAKATAFLTVKAFPEIWALVDEVARAAGNAVTGTGNFKLGTKVTLKAKAAKGWVFSGWEGASIAQGLQALSPSFEHVMTIDDLTEVRAKFIEIRDDRLSVGSIGTNAVKIVKGVDFASDLVGRLIDTGSYPTVKVSGLPSGIKFDAKAFSLTGKVSATAKTSVGWLTVEAKNAGGYSFVRLLKYAVVDSADSPVPETEALDNAANVDFSDLEGLVTGCPCPADGLSTRGFLVPAAENGSAVSSVAVTGLPTGLSSSSVVVDGVGEVVVFGTPSKPARFTVKVTVTYADRKKATSQCETIVEDGGCRWLDVLSEDDDLGTATGSGVYAAGAKVKPVAKAKSRKVFAGWYEEEGLPFTALTRTDGVDYRTPNPTFTFCPVLFQTDRPVLIAAFADAEEDFAPVIRFADPEVDWEIDCREDSSVAFDVDSLSLPKVAVSGLPKGVTCDAVRGRLAYDAAFADSVAPGLYTVTLKTTNVSNSKATVNTLRVIVHNKTSDVIGGLDPREDAYRLFSGVAADPSFLLPQVDWADGWQLKATGLPAGLKLVTATYPDGEKYCYVSGIATRASTNVVTFTATKGTGKDKQTAVATVTLAVAALPAWACGNFNGAYEAVCGGTTDAVGSVSASVTSAGRLSGRILLGGRSYSFAASALEAYDAVHSNFLAEVTVPWASARREPFRVRIGVGDDGVGRILLTSLAASRGGQPNEDFAWLVQNVWTSRKDLLPLPFATGRQQPVLAIGDLTCKFSSNGAVTLSGCVEGIRISGSSQVLTGGVEAGGDALMVVYFPGSKFAGGAYCRIYALTLEDTDDDGKIDSVRRLED